MRWRCVTLSALGAMCAGGCVSDAERIRSNCTAHSWCPTDQVAVIDVRPTPDKGHIYQVRGRDVDVQYTCTSGAGWTRYGPYAVRSCNARQLIDYEATDGTSHSAWFDDEVMSKAAAIEAVLASAAHDLPCDRASVKGIGTNDHGVENVVEGCGQRITYEISEVGDQPTPGRIGSVHIGPVRMHKYVVIARMSLVTPAPPLPPAQPSSAPGVVPSDEAFADLTSHGSNTSRSTRW